MVQAVVDAGPTLHLAPRRSRPAADGITASPWSAGRPQPAVLLIALFVGVFMRHTQAKISYDGELQATALAPGAHATAGVMHSAAGFRSSSMPTSSGRSRRVSTTRPG